MTTAKRSEQAKARLRAHRADPANVEYYAKQRKKRSQPEARLKRSEQRRAKYATDAVHRKALNDYNRDQYATKPKLRARMADINRKRARGATAFDLLLFNTQTRCECCGACFKSAYDKHFDHDHKTGKYRGALCSGCNVAEGRLKSSVARALALVAYLECHAHS